MTGEEKGGLPGEDVPGREAEEEFFCLQNRERLSTYLHTLDSPGDPFLEELRRTAAAEGVPVIRREMESFLRVLLAVKKPSRVLEAGTAVGYSALLMAKAGSDFGMTLTTIEKDSVRAEKARANIAAAGESGRITLIEGDAADVLHRLAEDGERFGFIFMDAAKGQYIHFLPDVLTLLEEGGILLSDNVLQDMTILDSHYALERRERTIHRRMREYLRVLKAAPGLLTSVIPIGDGAALTVKEEHHA